MEMLSTLFERIVVEMMSKIDDQNFLIVATVPSKSLTLPDKLKSHSSSKLFTVIFIVHVLVFIIHIFFKSLI